MFIRLLFMPEVYLILGSNIGDRKNYLEQAISMINEAIGKIQAKSSLYETVPWGFDDKNNFLNQVIKVETSLQPENLLKEILQIEKIIGRIRTGEKYSSRVIDIDILFYEKKIIHSENLVIPHPLMHERKFVLVPLAEISGQFIHPVFNKTIQILLNECKDELNVEKVV